MKEQNTLAFKIRFFFLEKMFLLFQNSIVDQHRENKAHNWMVPN